MVPSYSGVACLVAPLTGFFQSLVPVARPMKLATVSGVSFSKSVQRRVPAVVLKTAVGSAETARCTGVLAPVAGLAGVVGLAAGLVWVLELSCARTPSPATEKRIRMVTIL